jgi:hypothetical protein
MDWIRNDRLKTFACKTKMPSMHLTLAEKETKMNVATRAAGIALARRESMTLNDANVKITCRHGCLWLTERHGSEDIVLEPGQSHVARAPGVVIEALRASGFELRTLRPGAAAPGLRAWAGAALSAS